LPEVRQDQDASSSDVADNETEGDGTGVGVFCARWFCITNKMITTARHAMINATTPPPEDWLPRVFSDRPIIRTFLDPLTHQSS
jgi:hypothetical protein